MNFYGFLNASRANRIDEFALAGKAEFLLPKHIEISVSAWTKNGYTTVYGVDFTTYKFRTTWRGELSLSHGDNRHRLVKQNNEYVDRQITDEWVPRLCVGFTKSFDFREVNDRISVSGEFYYNDGGYEANMFKEEPIKTQFLEEGYFEPNTYGRYYAAIFLSIRKFLVSEMAYNLRAIGNLNDSSFIVSSGVLYELANNVLLTFELEGYLGAKEREYTLHGNALSATISMELEF